MLKAYEDIADAQTHNSTEAFEHSELLLYQAQLLHQAGHVQDSLDFLAAKQVGLRSLPFSLCSMSVLSSLAACLAKLMRRRHVRQHVKAVKAAD